MTAPTKRAYRPITDDDKRRVRKWNSRNFNDALIAVLLDEDVDRIRNIRTAARIPSVGIGRPTADAILNALRELIEEPDEQAVAERFDRLRRAGLSFDAALRAARAGDEAELHHGVYVGIRDLQGQAA